MDNLKKLKYPIGKFINPISKSRIDILNWIEVIELFPAQLLHEIEGLDEDNLSRKYRHDGWTITQIINHCTDSHLNSFMRFKLALTEDTPIIKPYREDLWAELPDSKNYPIQDAIKLLEGLHARWVVLLKSLDESDLEREFIHPESGQRISLKTNIGIYAWHCQHHLAHIQIAKNNQTL